MAPTRLVLGIGRIMLHCSMTLPCGRELVELACLAVQLLEIDGLLGRLGTETLAIRSSSGFVQSVVWSGCTPCIFASSASVSARRLNQNVTEVFERPPTKRS